MKKFSSLNHVGSPPRVREKLEEITQAIAGTWDHTRVCGKNLPDSNEIVWIVGSPPRVREKLDVPTCNGRTLRITPACAGKTSA